jgi:hypothetical protein
MADAFPKFPRHQALRPLLLLTAAGSVERIVGLAGVFDPVNAVAGLTLAVRPRFLADPGLVVLLAAAAQAAREAGATRLITTDDLRPGNPHLVALEQNGFAASRRLELWSTKLPRIRDRVARVQVRLEAAGRARRFNAEPLRAEHLAAVRGLMAAEHLLEGQEITLAGGDGGRGYDPAVSFVVFSGPELAGAILARRSGSEAVAVEAEAVAPAWRGGSNLVHHALYRACIQAADTHGVQHFIYTVDTAGHVDTRRMARRSDSRRLGESVQLVRPL